jgi:hypothetical protein
VVCRPNVYKIFAKASIDTSLLWRISHILKHDFFQELSEAMEEAVAKRATEV